MVCVYVHGWVGRKGGPGVNVYSFYGIRVM